MRRLLLLALLACAIPAIAAASAPPPGATARCRDGTYSFAKHHQGACSHHGGVAVWLKGAGASASVQVGRTILLAPRTKTDGCRVGPSPDRRCSPGAYYSKLTKRVLCSAGFRTSSIRNVPDSEKAAVEREYRLPVRKYGNSLEIDHIVPLEVGGSNDIANLFPEGAYANPGFHAKDRLENALHDRVCAGTIALRTAQRLIAGNWQALYESVFGAAP
jgi:hypothetical protein